jgi:hypothetical protein
VFLSQAGGKKGPMGRGKVEREERMGLYKLYVVYWKIVRAPPGQGKFALLTRRA